MPFDPDEIARLSPAARVEVQDFYARRFLAQREPPQPDRRAPARLAVGAEEAASAGPRQAWPRVWFRNDSSRPTSFPHQWPPPSRARGSVHIVPRTSSK